MVSIVVPCFAEKENIAELCERIHRSLAPYCEFEIIFVDDKSTDGTWELLGELANKYPIRAFRKVGKRGKAYSLVQGFAQAKFDLVAMIDADLQYPPEAILPMILKLGEVDIVVSSRGEDRGNSLRRVSSRAFIKIF